MPHKISLSQLINAFTPSKEIDDSEKFSGRTNNVKDAYHCLLSTGSNLAIVGGRGIGKTSLAKQIINICQGNNSLLDKLKIQYDEQLDFLTIYFACGDHVRTLDDLLRKLLTNKDCLYEWIYGIPSVSKELDKINGGLDFKIVKSGLENNHEKTTSPVIVSHDIDVVFQNVLQEIAKSKVSKSGILIVIDEFDQIENPKGFAKLLKSLATNVPEVKFCLVGVAQDIQYLMKEHESSDRLFASGVINLSPMSSSELKEIIETAEASIGNIIKFNLSAQDKLIELANGHPYIVHLLGKHSLLIAHTEQINEIDENLILRTLKEIAEKEADPLLEGRYKRAVASSYQREAVLKSLASAIQKDGEILTTEAYKTAIEFDVDNPSQYVGHLVTDDYGGELVKIRERYYRFRDSLFATYVKARPWLTNNNF